MVTIPAQLRLMGRQRYIAVTALIFSSFLVYRVSQGGRGLSYGHLFPYNPLGHDDQSPHPLFKTLPPTDPLFPRSEFELPSTGLDKSSTDLATHPPVQVAMHEGYWAGGTLFPMWGRNFTCRSGLRCITHADGYEDWAKSDVVLTLLENPGFHDQLDRSKTKLAFMGIEPYHFDVDMEKMFDIKASVYQTETTVEKWRSKPGPDDDRHVWTTYSEHPWREYLQPKALPDWSKKSKSRPIMFVSSNSCPEHRSDFVHKLVEKGLDVWSFGTCASEHETTDRVAKLKELCGDVYGMQDWRGPKNCITEHFKFILSIENSLHDDYASEKFFDPFAVGTVPIYWGPSNTESTYSPGPNSFINMRDYGTGDVPDHDKIIELIHYYNNNDDAYDKLFDWKRNGQFNPGFAEVNYRSWYNAACVLCEKSVEMDQNKIPWGSNRP